MSKRVKLHSPSPLLDLDKNLLEMVCLEVVLSRHPESLVSFALTCRAAHRVLRSFSWSRKIPDMAVWAVLGADVQLMHQLLHSQGVYVETGESDRVFAGGALEVCRHINLVLEWGMDSPQEHNWPQTSFCKEHHQFKRYVNLEGSHYGCASCAGAASDADDTPAPVGWSLVECARCDGAAECHLPKRRSFCAGCLIKLPLVALRYICDNQIDYGGYGTIGAQRVAQEDLQDVMEDMMEELEDVDGMPNIVLTPDSLVVRMYHHAGMAYVAYTYVGTESPRATNMEPE